MWACDYFFHKVLIIAGNIKNAAKYKNKSSGVTPFYFFLKILDNLSIDVNPRAPKANNATASTRYSAGLMSLCVKVLATRATTNAKTQSKPPNLLDE